MKGCTTHENFCIVQGDSLRVIVSVRDQSGGEIDLQDADSIRWWAAKRPNQPPAIKRGGADGGIHLSDPDIFYFDLFPQNTSSLTPGNYYHEAEIVTNLGHVYTVMMGSLLIRPQLIT